MNYIRLLIKRTFAITLFSLLSIIPLSSAAQQLDAQSLIQAAMDNWRGVTSYSEVTMTIHRADWERAMSMKVWTAGDDKSLVRVTAPKKDVGNATLINDDYMWSFAPKINRVIKIPSSMMNQSWMGSDFSNKDISRSTELLNSYNHSIRSIAEEEGHTIYTIDSIPHADAPIVWGKEVLVIRDDYVVLKQEYWDQDGELIKIMETKELAVMGGRSVAKSMRMFKLETPYEWTQIDNTDVEFDIEISDSVFTLSNLRNPRE